MQIYVHKNNQQLGPFTEAEVKAQLAAGTITLLDHVWWQGQANWMPLGQTPLAAPGTTSLPGVTATPLPGGAAPYAAIPATSTLAIWSLVCGCLSILCGFLCIPAIIMGHLGLADIKKHPGKEGRGMAIAGTVIGYLFLVLMIVCFIVFAALGNQVREVFKTINAQMAAGAAQSGNSSDDSTTNSDQSTNSSDQSTPSSSNSTTNAAPASQ